MESCARWRSSVLFSLCMGTRWTLPFVYDDSLNILENTRIHSFSPLWGPLITDSGRGVSGRPLAALSFAVNYAISGEQTWSYHLVNILIHAAVAVMLCNLILLMLKECPVTGSASRRIKSAAHWLAFWSALLWCVHPLTTQAVTYVTQRLESQAALFFVCCIYCAVRGRSARKPGRWYLAAIAAYLLGAGTKESVILAPFLIAAYEYIIRGKGPAEFFAEAKLLYGGLAVAMVLHIILILFGGQLDEGVKTTLIPMHSYIFTQGEVLLHYFRLVFWPAPLILDYGWETATFWQGVGPFLLILALVCATLFWALCRRAWSFPLVWIFFTLAPTSLSPMVDPAVEYRMYVPLMGVVFLVVLACAQGLDLLGRSGRTSRLRLVSGLLGVLAVLCLGCVSAQRNTDYSDELKLWEDNMAKRPLNWRGYYNHGVTLQNRKRFGDAIDSYLRVLEVKPKSCKVYINLGICLINENNPQDALSFLERAKKCYGEAEDLRAYELSANAYKIMGNFEAAVDEMREAVRIDPSSERLAFLLGLMYLKANNRNMALQQFCRAGALSGRWEQQAAELHKTPQELRAMCAP